MLERIELQNWKKFDKIDLDFSTGLNFIIGPNGIGKSSILQAICVAFTGNVQEFSLIDLRDFIRKGKREAKIKVRLKRRSDTVCIERTINRRGRQFCSMLDSKDRVIFKDRWEAVTTEVLKEFNIRTLFFNRIVYLSEGDIYRTIREPPGKSLLREIDLILGIRKSGSLRRSIHSLKKEFEQKQVEYRNLTERIALIESKRSLQDLIQDLDSLQRERKVNQEYFNEVLDRLFKLKAQVQGNERILSDLMEIESEQSRVEQETIKRESAERKLENVIAKINSAKVVVFGASGEISKLQKVLDLTKSKALVARTRCPVCNKLLSKHEIEQIRKRANDEVRSLQEKVVNLNQSLKQLEQEKIRTQELLTTFKEREQRLKLLQERIPISTRDLFALRKKIASSNAEIKKLEKKKEKASKEADHLEIKIEELREELGVLKTLDQRRKLPQIEDELITASKGEYLSDFVLKGLDDFVRRQRDSELRKKIYAQISQIWSIFKGEEGWNVRLDKNALPLTERESFKYPFPLLSGGEKTALLVVSRMVLSRLFASDVDFLLLDEPFEHLDQRHRRSLLRFLFECCSKNIVNQLIVTTVEESLVRSFGDLETAKLVSL